MSNVSTVVGVPYDCTGRFAGRERPPAARLLAELFGDGDARSKTRGVELDRRR